MPRTVLAGGEALWDEDVVRDHTDDPVRRALPHAVAVALVQGVAVARGLARREEALRGVGVPGTRRREGEAAGLGVGDRGGAGAGLRVVQAGLRVEDARDGVARPHAPVRLRDVAADEDGLVAHGVAQRAVVPLEHLLRRVEVQMVGLEALLRQRLRRGAQSISIALPRR